MTTTLISGYTTSRRRGSVSSAKWSAIRTDLGFDMAWIPDSRDLLYPCCSATSGENASAQSCQITHHGEIALHRPRLSLTRTSKLEPPESQTFPAFLRVNNSDGVPIATVRSVVGLSRCSRAFHGFLYIDEIGSDPLPCGHTSRRWGLAVERADASISESWSRSTWWSAAGRSITLPDDDVGREYREWRARVGSAATCESTRFFSSKII